MLIRGDYIDGEWKELFVDQLRPETTFYFNFHIIDIPVIDFYVKYQQVG